MRRITDRTYRRVAVVVAAIACLGVSLPVAPVQAHEWDMQGTVGAAVPLSDLADTHDAGVGVGLGFTRWANKWAGFHLGTAVNMLGGKSSAPDLTLWHYNAGIETDLIDPATSKVRLHANLGLGGTTTSVQDGDSSTDFTLNVGPNLEYKFNANWNGLVGTQLYVIFADTTQYVLPVYVGFRYAFND